jgi:hypothetical protein
MAPLFPPLALFAALFWKKLNEKEIRITKPLLVSSWMLAITYAILPFAGLLFIRIRPMFVEGISDLDIFGAVILFLVSALVIGVILIKRKFHRLLQFQVTALIGLAILGFDALSAIQFKNAKVFADKIRELQKPGDLVLMYNSYFASLPFYLRERMITVGIPTETTFEPAEELEQYVFPDLSSIRSFIESPRRIFVLTNQVGLERAQSFAQHTPVYPLMRRQKLVLFSNRP